MSVYRIASSIYKNVDNFGIGITNPTHKLHIYTTSSNNNDYESAGILLDNATQGEAAIAFRNSNVSANGNVWVMGLNSNSTRFDIGYGAQTSQLADALVDMCIDVGGNVGIGTTIPLKKLDIQGDINFNGSLYQNNALYVSSQWTSNNETNSLYYNGNVGIGVTDPKATLHILGDTINVGSLTANQFTAFGDTLGEPIVTFYDNNSSVAMSIIYNGNVGIGTDNPLQKLHVEGTSYLNGAIITNNNNINAGTGTVTATNFSGTATRVSQEHVPGSYLTGTNYNGVGTVTWAVDATSANTASKVVVRDASGNFSAGTITGTLSGTATRVSQEHVPGSYLTGTNYNGVGTVTWAVDATSANTASKVVVRDASGNFSAGTITGTLSGTATRVSQEHVPGTYLTGTNYNGVGTVTWAVDATTANTANKVVVRDASGNFSAGTITANTFSGTATRVSQEHVPGSYLTGTNYNGVGTVTWAVDATTAATGNKVVVRDASGNFSAGTITGTLSGTATRVSQEHVPGTYLTGTNYNGVGTVTWAVDATTANTANKVVVRDASGNFSAGTITANTFSGTATRVSQEHVPGTYLTGTNYNGIGTVTWAVDATTAATANKVVVRDASGNFSAGTITASGLTGGAITDSTSTTSSTIAASATAVKSAYALAAAALPTIGGTVTGNVTILANLTASNLTVIGDTTILNTISSNTEQMVITNAGTGPALKVTQTGVNSVAEFYDNESGLAMTIANNGLVGIGTTNPLSKLHVYGYPILGGTSTDSGPTRFLSILDSTITNGSSKYITFGKANSTNNQAEFSYTHQGDGSATNFIGMGLYGSLAMTINGDGNVGIGTFAPNNKLHLNGNAYFNGTITTNSNNINAGTGTVTASTFSGTATRVSNDLVVGTYLTGTNYNGAGTTTWAVDATSANTANKVVVRDASGNFSAGTITASLTGTATKVSNDLVVGTYLTGTNYNGIGTVTWAVDATSANTASKVVVRDASGNFSAGTITANTFSGTATRVSQEHVPGSYLTGTNYNGVGTVTWAVDATSANTASKVVVRDASGNFSAGTITASLTGTATRVSQEHVPGTYLTGTNYNGVGTVTWAVDATSANTASKVVVRDASGNFSAGTITASLTGTATRVSQEHVPGSYLTGTNYNGVGTVTWAVDATSTATANKVVARDASGYTFVSGVGIGTATARQLLDVQGGDAIVSGSVGIGTTAPTHKMHLYSTNTTDNNYEATGIYLQNESVGETGIAFRNITLGAGNVWVMGLNNSSSRFDIGFGAQSSQITDALVDMCIKTDGNVGIGTTNPLQKLHVAGDINFTGTLYQNGTAFTSGGGGVINQINYIDPLRKVFYVQETSQNQFILTTEGLYGGYASNIQVFVGQNLLSYYNSNICDYNLSIGYTSSSTIYTVTLTESVDYASIVDITIWPTVLTSSQLYQYTNYQMAPIRSVSYVNPGPTSTFTLSTNGYFGGTACNVELFVDNNKLTYYSDTINDYQLAVSYDFINTKTNYTVTLTNPAVFGNLVDITVWPQSLPEYMANPLKLYQYINLQYTTPINAPLQVTPVRKVFYVDSNEAPKSIFDVITSGIYGGNASNVQVFVGQSLLSYYNSTISDYTLGITYNGNNTTYRITLINAVEYASLVDITIWPTVLPGSEMIGSIYQNVTTTSQWQAGTGNSIYYNVDNVGIGITNPTAKLHVVGNVLATGTITASNISIIGDFVTMNTVTSNTEQMVITNAGTGPALKVIQTGNNSVAEFYDNESGIALYVGNNGNVGIGTTNPQSKLHITGATKLGNTGDNLEILGCQNPIIIGGALSDETSALTTTNSLKLYAPYNFNVRSTKLPKFTINTAATSTITFDITKNGTTIYSVKPTITNTNVTSSSTGGTLTTNPTLFSENDTIIASVNTAGTGGTGAKLYIYCT